MTWFRDNSTYRVRACGALLFRRSGVGSCTCLWAKAFVSSPSHCSCASTANRVVVVMESFPTAWCRVCDSANNRCTNPECGIFIWCTQWIDMDALDQKAASKTFASDASEAAGNKRSGRDEAVALILDLIQQPQHEGACSMYACLHVYQCSGGGCWCFLRAALKAGVRWSLKTHRRLNPESLHHKLRRRKG